MTVAFEPSKEAHHLVSALVERSMIVTFDKPVCLWCSIHRAISQWLAGRFLGAPVSFDRPAVQAQAINCGSCDALAARQKTDPSHPLPPNAAYCANFPSAAAGHAICIRSRRQKDGVNDCKVANAQISALNRQIRRGQRVLLFCYPIHNNRLAEITPER